MPTIHQCKNCQSNFTITKEDLAFYEKISPIFAGKKYSIPAPSLCPDCRQQKRLAWQNMYKLYKRKCDATGKMVISNFSSDKPYKIYDQNYRWSDQWDFKKYAKDFTPNKSFFAQFKELMLATPMPTLFTEFLNDINSNYTNFAGYNKNCYLIFHADMNEDCLYATGLKNSKKCTDSLNVFDCEFTYECVDCQNCYGTIFCQDCENCANSWFLKDCIGCKNCFACVNLNNAEYTIFNKQVSKQEYTVFMDEIFNGKEEIIKTYKEKFEEIKKQGIYKPTAGHQNENCIGDHLFRCKNVQESRDIKDSRDMKFCERIYNGPNRDCYDVDQFGMQIERVYNTSVIGNKSQNVISCATSYNLQDVYYSIYAFNSKNCFGCVGIRQAEYCILNKQYTKEEYEKLVPQIIEQMQKDGERGEFFPIALSPFAYNETVAQEYFLLTKVQIDAKGYQWKEDEEKSFQGTAYIPLSIDQYDLAKVGKEEAEQNQTELLNGILKCEVSGKAFRIVKPELECYIRNHLPIPNKHPDIRHLERLSLRNPRKLRDRKCAKCGVDIRTSFAPERPEIVYCEACYNKEMYG